MQVDGVATYLPAANRTATAATGASEAVTAPPVDVSLFRRYQHATTDDLRALLGREATELCDQYREAASTGEVDCLPYMRDAMRQIHVRAGTPQLFG